MEKHRLCEQGVAQDLNLYVGAEGKYQRTIKTVFEPTWLGLRGTYESIGSISQGFPNLGGMELLAGQRYTVVRTVEIKTHLLFVWKYVCSYKMDVFV